MPITKKRKAVQDEDVERGKTGVGSSGGICQMGHEAMACIASYSTPRVMKEIDPNVSPSYPSRQIASTMDISRHAYDPISAIDTTTGQDFAQLDGVSNSDIESEASDKDEPKDDEVDEEDFELYDDHPDLTVGRMQRIAERDESMSEEDQKQAKLLDGGIDRWILKYLKRQYAGISREAMELASVCSPIVKEIIVQESKGLFDYKDDSLQKAFKFRSSFRDLFLQDIDGDQVLDQVLAIMLHAGSTQLRDAFFALFESGSGGTLRLDDTFANGVPGNAAVKEVGLYLRTLDDFDYYCGISRDIARRQLGHNSGQPGHQGNRKMKAALNGRPAARVVKSRRLVSFGKTGLSECPQPVLNCMETMIISAARLTTSPNSIQVNLIDCPPYVPPPKPAISSDEIEQGRILAEVWEKMFRYRQEQMVDFGRGRFFGLGCRPIPIGIDGIARADKEARILIIPVIRSAKVGMSWVMCNLHRTWTFEKDGEILEQSKYPALESAKAQFPIPSHAFFRGYDAALHRHYVDQGYKEATRGNYQEWAATLTGPNGHHILQPAVGERKAGLLGIAKETVFSAETLEETKRQAWALWRNLENGLS